MKPVRLVSVGLLAAVLVIDSPAQAADGPELSEEVFVKKPQPTRGAVGSGRTSSGVFYEVLTRGSGAVPRRGDSVRVHYVGTFEDGRKFDSSRDRNEPLVMPLSRMIQGWQDALEQMPVGSRWKLHVPSRLAYGARGAGNVIPPHTDLVFDVELLSIE